MRDRYSGDVMENDKDRVVLGLLNAVEQNNMATQRHMAQDLGIALGLANACLKRCINKGLIKVKQAPANRYIYYLTASGFMEKSRLTTQYIKISFNLFRHSRLQYSELLDACVSAGRNRVALLGIGELSEIVILCAREHNLEIVGVVDPTYEEDTYLGLVAVRTVDDLNAVDAYIITDLEEPQKIYDSLKVSTPNQWVLAPKMLNISKNIEE
ncbi:MAG: winged helix-turn-helix transcriptional regulator [Rhodospirillales bacterium]|nr:winged helix-turn-helix transcriptional regulator [Rhodospirillales bacterium]